MHIAGIFHGTYIMHTLSQHVSYSVTTASETEQVFKSMTQQRKISLEKNKFLS